MNRCTKHLILILIVALVLATSSDYGLGAEQVQVGQSFEIGKDIFSSPVINDIDADNPGSWWPDAEYVEFDFGDGVTKIAHQPGDHVHSYSRPDTYTIRYRVIIYPDSGGVIYGSWETLGTIVAVGGSSPPPPSPPKNKPPTAKASANKTSVKVGQTISFDGSGSSDPDGSISSYHWSFGDGQTSSTKNPSHSYSTGGRYTVTLKVTDNKGASDTSSITITVSENKAPIAKPKASKLTAYVGEKINFDASDSYDPDGKIVSYAWSFAHQINKGSIGYEDIEEKNPIYTWYIPSIEGETWPNWPVKLEVTDDEGATSYKNIFINIKPLPSGVPISYNANDNNIQDKMDELAEKDPTAVIVPSIEKAQVSDEPKLDSGLSIGKINLDNLPSAHTFNVGNVDYLAEVGKDVDIFANDIKADIKTDHLNIEYSVWEKSTGIGETILEKEIQRSETRGSKSYFDDPHNVNYKFDKPGSYRVMIRIKDDMGNTAVAKTTIKVVEVMGREINLSVNVRKKDLALKNYRTIGTKNGSVKRLAEYAIVVPIKGVRKGDRINLDLRNLPRFENDNPFEKMRIETRVDSGNWLQSGAEIDGSFKVLRSDGFQFIESRRFTNTTMYEPKGNDTFIPMKAINFFKDVTDKALRQIKQGKRVGPKDLFWFGDGNIQLGLNVKSLGSNLYLLETKETNLVVVIHATGLLQGEVIRRADDAFDIGTLAKSVAFDIVGIKSPAAGVTMKLLDKATSY